MKKILFAIALAVVVAACQPNNNDTVQRGRLSISASTQNEVSYNTSTSNGRWVLDSELVPREKDLSVEIVSNDNRYTWNTLTEFERAVNDGFLFVSAPYIITLAYGEKGAEGWSKPYFEGKTSVEIPGFELTAEAEVEVTLANSIVAIATTERFDGYFPQASFEVKGITWEPERKESLFVDAGEVTIVCTATRQTGKTTTLTSNVLLKPTTRHTILFDLSTAGNVDVEVSFDGDIVEVTEEEFELNDNA